MQLVVFSELIKQFFQVSKNTNKNNEVHTSLFSMRSRAALTLPSSKTYFSILAFL